MEYRRSIILILLSSVFTILAGVQMQSSTSSRLETLQLVQILHRHGTKNPEYVYPNDPYNNEDFWPGGWAQLTDEGVAQTYELGRFLRKRYEGFISHYYDQYETYVLSSDTDRTIRSALSNLAGLFSLETDTGIQIPLTTSDKSVNWYPVPIRTVLNSEDNIFRKKKVCPNYRDSQDHFRQNSDVMKPINKENEALFDYISKHAGINMTYLDKQLGYFHDALMLEDRMNYTLPNWTLPIYNSEPVVNLVALSFGLATYTTEFKRFYVGPFLQLIRNNIKAKTEKMNEGDFQNATLFPDMHDHRRRMVIFSGHDTNLCNFMDALGVYEQIRPPFASALMLELHKNSTADSYYLELWYRNISTRDPYFLPLETQSHKFANTPISLENFLSKIDPLIPDDWVKECNSNELAHNDQIEAIVKNGQAVKGVVQFFIGAIFGIAIVIIISALLKYTKRKNRNAKEEYISY